jgi:hypothetical protein
MTTTKLKILGVSGILAVGIAGGTVLMGHAASPAATSAEQHEDAEKEAEKAESGEAEPAGGGHSDEGPGAEAAGADHQFEGVE